RASTPSGGSRCRMGRLASARKSVPSQLAAKQRLLQFLGPPTASAPSAMMTKLGRLSLTEPRPYVVHDPSDGRPPRDATAFIWHTEPTWFNPSVHNERMTHRSSACCAMCRCQSETHVAEGPYCFHLRGDGRIVLSLVPIAVMTRPKDEGIGLPASVCS